MTERRCHVATCAVVTRPCCGIQAESKDHKWSPPPRTKFAIDTNFCFDCHHPAPSSPIQCSIKSPPYQFLWPKGFSLVQYGEEYHNTASFAHVCRLPFERRSSHDVCSPKKHVQNPRARQCFVRGLKMFMRGSDSLCKWDNVCKQRSGEHQEIDYISATAVVAPLEENGLHHGAARLSE